MMLMMICKRLKIIFGYDDNDDLYKIKGNFCYDVNDDLYIIQI